MLETVREQAGGGPDWTFDGHHRVPLPMTRADEMTVAHLLAFLAARGHRVDFVSIMGKGERLEPANQHWLEAHCRSVRLVKQSRLAALWQAGIGLLRGWPLQAGYFHVPAQLAAAREFAAKRRYDLAYAYGVRSTETLRGRQSGAGSGTGLAGVADLEHTAPGAECRSHRRATVLSLRELADEQWIREGKNGIGLKQTGLRETKRGSCRWWRSCVKAGSFKTSSSVFSPCIRR